MGKPKGESRGLAFLQSARPEAMGHLLKFFAASARHLDPKTRFLISVVTKVVNFSPRGIQQYVRRAREEGASPDEIIDAILCAYPCAGLTRVVDAVDVLLDMGLPGFEELGSAREAAAPAIDKERRGAGEESPCGDRPDARVEAGAASGGESGAGASTGVTREWVEVGGLADFIDGQRLHVRMGRYDVAVFRIDAGFFAVDNLCPHRAGPLIHGTLADHVVVCPLHRWKFDLKSGASTDHPGCSVRRYEVRVAEGGRVLLKL